MKAYLFFLDEHYVETTIDEPNDTIVMGRRVFVYTGTDRGIRIYRETTATFMNEPQ